VVPIWIGLLEAKAIALALEGTELPRPMTHDLMKSILHATGMRLRSVEIAEIARTPTSPSFTSRNGRACASTRVPAMPSHSPCAAARDPRIRSGPRAILDPGFRGIRSEGGTNGPSCLKNGPRAVQQVQDVSLQHR